ncbi:MAG: phosphatidylserine decarboxylase [Spirochaetales bacterium]|nr:phosphatidylserine decarboxylase [Spirochaetales bacterium]
MDYGESHEAVTLELIGILEGSAELKALLEKSIAKAHQINPDPMTNPVHDLGSYLRFLDRCSRSMPWEINPTDEYDLLYDRIDQGMGCLYFVCDQPLEELEGRGYYHNSLIHHQPFSGWFRRFLSAMGSFLDTERSWCDEYFRNALACPSFHLDDGTYEDPSNWRTFNGFFARRLADPSRRPISEPDNPCVVVSPADSKPFGLWRIDSGSRFSEGVGIKTFTFNDVRSLLGCSRFADEFGNGAITHTTLDVNDYHRFHFPVDGTVREVLHIPQNDGPGGVITWVSAEGCYRAVKADGLDWQPFETRAVVVIETAKGHVAVVPVGMCQVCSVNFENSVVPGAKVRKGDPMGHFLFGGSDIAMVFSEDLCFEVSAAPGRHLLMGEEYGRIRI